ncbi:MAG: hypothetical protein WCO35_00230 [Candidatus Nomurabacteria bacterium]
MTKKFFQRSILTLIILLTMFIHVPSIFKDTLIILFVLFLFLSTFDIYPKKKNRSETIVG